MGAPPRCEPSGPKRSASETPLDTKIAKTTNSRRSRRKGGYEGSSRSRFLHGKHQIGGQPHLHDVASPAGSPGCPHELLVIVNGKKHNGRCNSLLAEAGGDLEAGHSRH